jgi:two-component system, response regulator
MSSRPLVLLVEDNPSDEQLALRGLRSFSIDCQVDVARDGVEAVEYLLHSGRILPNFVLLDLKLPKMSGLEVLGKIRSEERTRRLPVVCFTSSREHSDLIGCFDSGANSFVHKATDYDEYMARLRKLLDYWLTVNEPCF